MFLVLFSNGSFTVSIPFFISPLTAFTSPCRGKITDPEKSCPIPFPISDCHFVSNNGYYYAFRLNAGDSGCNQKMIRFFFKINRQLALLR